MGLSKILSTYGVNLLALFAVTLSGLIVVAWVALALPGPWLWLLVLLTAVAITSLGLWFSYRSLAYMQLLRRQRRIITALGQEVTATSQLDELLATIAALIQTEFEYDCLALFLLDEQQTITHFVQKGGPPLPFAVATAVSREQTIGAAAFGQQPIVINGTSNNAPHCQPVLLPGMQAELTLPLLVGLKPLGLLHIQSRQSAPFDLDHTLALQSVAGQTAVTIRNAILYQRESERRYLAETLYAIGLTLSGTLDREQVLDNILEQLASVIPYGRAALLLHRPQEQQLEIVAAKGFPEHSQPLQIRIPLDGEDSDDIYLTIHRTQRPLVVPDLSKLPGWIHVEGLPLARSWLGVPLVHDKEVIGMLSLVRETDEVYTQEDTIPATTFAIQAAVALHNAELYNKIDLFNRQLAYEVEQRTQAVIQLARLDEAKTDFINVAAHELRTPLTSIQGYSQMLMQEQSINENGYQNQLVAGIYQSATRLHDIVNNMLSVAKIDSQTLNLHFQPLSLSYLLERIRRAAQTSVAERHLQLELQPLTAVPDIEADREGLHTVFSHLLRNAIKYTPDGGCITIQHQLIGQPTPSHVQITVTDTGIGIPPEAQELIFTKFYQTGKLALHSSGQTKFKGGGPGLGLAIVRGIVEAHNGRVWAESAGYDEAALPGSHFHVLLPIKQAPQPNDDPCD